MNDYQEQVSAFFEKQVEANTKLWEVNTQYAESFNQRQAAYMAELVEVTTENLKKMGEATSYSNVVENSTDMGKKLVEKMTSLNKENAEAYNVFQKNIVKVYEPLYAAV